MRVWASGLFLSLLHLFVLTAHAHDPVKHVIVLGETGNTPKTLHIQSLGASVFFYNESTTLSHIEIQWGEKAAHCASFNLELTKEGVLRTIRPVTPGDFALTCFPHPGKYSYRVTNSARNQTAHKGEILISGEMKK